LFLGRVGARPGARSRAALCGRGSVPACHVWAGPWHARFVATSIYILVCCGFRFSLRATTGGDSGPAQSDLIGTSSRGEKNQAPVPGGGATLIGEGVPRSPVCHCPGPCLRGGRPWRRRLPARASRGAGPPSPKLPPGPEAVWTSNGEGQVLGLLPELSP